MPLKLLGLQGSSALGSTFHPSGDPVPWRIPAGHRPALRESAGLQAEDAGPGPRTGRKLDVLFLFVGGWGGWGGWVGWVDGVGGGVDGVGGGGGMGRGGEVVFFGSK